MAKTADAAPLLSVEDLKTYYPIKKGVLSRTVGYVKAVDGVNFSIYPGETLGLVGESGCGKSTIGRSIIRLEKPTEGRIIFQNENILDYPSQKMKQVRTDMQMIFQDPYSSLNPRKRVKDILAEPLLVHGVIDPEQVQSKVDELMEMVGLSKHYKNRYPMSFPEGSDSISELPGPLP